MPELPQNYRRLIALGIDKSANLPDLNDMTDRGAFPMKPWTAAKTASTIGLIRKFNIKDEETLVEKFQEQSKIPLETLTEQVYQHQIKYFGRYKYDKDTVFKYAYCCVVLNSLAGNTTEEKFDVWAMQNNIRIKNPPALLDQKYHTDRLQTDTTGKTTAFISIKPNSFHHGFLQYTDVFGGLQMISEIKGIPWKIYYRENDIFRLIQYENLDPGDQRRVKVWATGYSIDERTEFRNILSSI